MIWFSWSVDSNLLYNAYVFQPAWFSTQRLTETVCIFERKRLLIKENGILIDMVRARGIVSIFSLSGLLKHWIVSHIFDVMRSQSDSLFFCTPMQIAHDLWNKKDHRTDVSFFKCYAAFMYPELAATDIWNSCSPSHVLRFFFCVCMSVQILNRFIN